MIKKNSGDGHRYEPEYPRLSLFHARIEFVNAIRKCVPEVFEKLHTKPLERYKESGLPRLKPKRRLEFWQYCYGGGHLASYLHGCAPIEREGLFQTISDHQQYQEAYEAYIKTGGTEAIRKALLLPVGDRNRIKRHVYQFIPDFGLDIGNRTHTDFFEKEIYPGLLAWLESLEEWAFEYNLNVGWMLHWAFIKLDTYVGKEDTAYAIYRELNPPITDIFGKDIQPPEVPTGNILGLNLYDFWMEELQIVCDPWRPLVQTAEEFERRAREDFDNALKRYITDCKTYLDLRPDLKRSWGKTRTEHYEWLARYQCLNQTHKGIANEVNQARETVRDGITDVAEFIELPLRTPQPGRKKGSKDRGLRRRVVR